MDVMAETRRVLLLDDNPDDRILVLRELKRDIPEIQIDEVLGPDDFERVLSLAPADLVITDYHLVWNDGLAVLRRLKSCWPGCPVIMFTGTGSEEIAVEGMKTGLADYVLKSPRHFARLSAAVQAALRLDEQRREIRAAEARFSMLFNSVPVGLYRLAPSGEILDANPALVTMLRYPDIETLKQQRAEALHADPAEYQKWQKLLERKGVVAQFETRLCRFDGTVCWVESNAKLVPDPVAKLVYYEGSLEDITDRKEAEHERERLITELQKALSEIKTLAGLLPICAACKKIRDDHGHWNQIESYIQSHSEAEFTHSFCPDCVTRLYSEVFEGEAR
jgi:PAS domain S-box-containing protein